jgi:hypothetical protein
MKLKKIVNWIEKKILGVSKKPINKGNIDVHVIVTLPNSNRTIHSYGRISKKMYKTSKADVFKMMGIQLMHDISQQIKDEMV